MNIDHDEGTDADPFGQKLFSFQQDGDVYEAVVVGRSGQYFTVCWGRFKQKVMVRPKDHHSMKEYPI